MEMMLAIGGKRYAVELDRPRDLSIPVRFDGAALSAFGAEPARREAYKSGDFTGDVRKGGSCNCDVLHFSPHLHGTHTECVGHISKAPVSINDILQESLIPATLVTVATENLLIAENAVAQALSGCHPDFLAALVIRTLPNGPDKILRHYGTAGAPFFSLEAMRALVASGVKHLLVDLPSIDRLDDGGKLINHRLFWENESSRKTVTELIYVPDTVKDGAYLLNLQVAPLASDAAPSRPVLYQVNPA